MKKVETKQTVFETLTQKGSVSNLGIFCQVILVGILFILFVMSIFLPFLDLTVEAVLAFTLFVTAYNNHQIFHRKYFTVIYVFMGLLVIGATIYSVLYGV